MMGVLRNAASYLRAVIGDRIQETGNQWVAGGRVEAYLQLYFFSW